MTGCPFDDFGRGIGDVPAGPDSTEGDKAIPILIRTAEYYHDL